VWQAFAGGFEGGREKARGAGQGGASMPEKGLLCGLACYKRAMRSPCCAGLLVCMLLPLKSHAQLSPEEEAPRQYPLSVFVQVPWGHWVFGKKIPAAEGGVEAHEEESPEAGPAHIRRRSFPLALGIRGEIVILQGGFSPTYDDQFGLSLGMDIGEMAKGLWISTPLEFWWRLFLYYRLSVYARVGAGIGWTILSHQEKTSIEVFPIALMGVEYRFSHLFSLRAEGGFPWGRIGLAF